MSWRPYEPCLENEQAARRRRWLPSDPGLFLTRQLEYIRPGLYDVKFPQLPGAKFIPMGAKFIPMETPKVGIIHDELEHMRANPAPLMNHDRGDEDDAAALEPTITRNWPEFVKSRGGVCPVCRGFRTGHEHFTKCRGMR